MRWRLLIACLVGLAAGVLCYHELLIHHTLAADYTWIWRGGRDLVHGRNPYRNPSLNPDNPYPWNAPLYYPLPAVLLGLPTIAAPATIAGAIFVALSFAALAFVLLGQERWRILILCSAPAFCAIRSAQWSPLVIAVSLIPVAVGVAPLLKPNLGVPMFIMKGGWKGIWIGAAAFIVSLLVMPGWPFSWLQNIRENRHTIPLLVYPFGPLLLLTLAGWRKRTSWQFLLFALIPQRMIWYDQFPLLIFPTTKRQTTFLLVTSWAGFIGWNLAGGKEKIHRVDDIVSLWVIVSLYLPTMLVVLWQARESLVGLGSLTARLQRRQSQEAGDEAPTPSPV